MGKIRTLLLSLAVALLALPFFGAFTAPVSAAADAKDAICRGINGSGGENCKVANTPSLQDTIRNVINIFSVIAGIAAVIMIIVGGFRYVTSGGDSGSVSSAKNTVIYALVGIVVVAIAQVLVHFVLEIVL